VKGTGSRPSDLGVRRGAPAVARREWSNLAWATWATLFLLNVAATAAWPSVQTIVFHLIAIGFTALYWLRIWPANPMLWVSAS
jgi:hypothetical protein